MDEGKGKCATCGFFGLSEGAAGRTIARRAAVQVSIEQRQYGNVFDIGVGRSSLRGVPVCILNKADFTQYSLSYFEDHNVLARSIAADLQKERNCQYWYPYRPGATPGEHLEEKRMIDFAERQEKFHRELLGEQKAFHSVILDQQKNFFTGLEESRRKWEEQRDAIRDTEARKTKKIEIFLTVAGVLLALVQLAAITPDALIFRLFK